MPFKILISAFQFFSISVFYLDGVHEGSLDVREEHQANGDDHEHDAEAGGELRHIHIAHAQKSPPKTFENRRQGIEVCHPAILLLDEGNGVDHRCGIHREGGAKANEVCQISVTGREGGNNDAAAEAIACQHQKKNRGA